MFDMIALSFVLYQLVYVNRYGKTIGFNFKEYAIG